VGIILLFADEVVKSYIGRYYFFQVAFVHMQYIFRGCKELVFFLREQFFNLLELFASHQIVGDYAQRAFNLEHVAIVNGVGGKYEFDGICDVFFRIDLLLLCLKVVFETKD